PGHLAPTLLPSPPPFRPRFVNKQVRAARRLRQRCGTRGIAADDNTAAAILDPIPDSLSRGVVNPERDNPDAIGVMQLGFFAIRQDRKSTRLNSSHVKSSY